MIRAELWDGLLRMFAEEIGWEGGLEGGVIGYQGGRVVISSLRLQWFHKMKMLT